MSVFVIKFSYNAKFDNYNNDHMKSEFYRQVSNQRKMRKSTTKQKPKKDTIHSAHINPIRMSKGLKSQTRALIKSIDLNHQAKQLPTDRMLRMSFSRPFMQVEQDIQPPQIHEKSIVSICCECENLKEKHQKQIKSMKMHYQEDKVALKEKFIQMQKKFLLKESECINLSTDIRSLMHENDDLKETITEVVQQMQDLRQKLQSSEQEVIKLNEQLKKYQDQNKFFNHFLTAFVQQTRNMIYWCEMFENTYEDLPKNIDSVRQDLTNRKMDLDVILKESISYQNNNFGISAIKDSNNSSFFGSEQDGTQSFMKYLKQNTILTKTKNTKNTPLTQEKLKSPFSQALTINKQNINTMNRLSFEDLIHSRINLQTDKKKNNNIKDDFLRMMLLQAQTIESNVQSKTNRNSKSHFSVDGSILSSIRKRVDHYVQ